MQPEQHRPIAVVLPGNADHRDATEARPLEPGPATDRQHLGIAVSLARARTTSVSCSI